MGDNIFALMLLIEIIQQDEDVKPRSVNEYRLRNYWPKWKETIQTELTSLEKSEIFWSIVWTPEGVNLVDY